PKSGGVGVDIFFALSGFLITTILLNELDTHGSIKLRHFYVRRFLRLVPCLWLTVTFFALYSWWMGRLGDTTTETDTYASLLYIMNWVRAYGAGGDGPLGHTWSLAIEEQFYLIWPILIFMLCISKNLRVWHGLAFLVAACAAAMYRCAMVG